MARVEFSSPKCSSSSSLPSLRLPSISVASPLRPRGPPPSAAGGSFTRRPTAASPPPPAGRASRFRQRHGRGRRRRRMMSTTKHLEAQSTLMGLICKPTRELHTCECDIASWTRPDLVEIGPFATAIANLKCEKDLFSSADTIVTNPIECFVSYLLRNGLDELIHFSSSLLAASRLPLLRGDEAFNLSSFQFIEATITQEEECTQVSNKTTSSNPENMLLSSQGLPDNFTDEATKDQYLCNSGLQAANRESKKKNSTFLTKFQNRIIASLASESSPCRNAFRRPLLSREIVVREYFKLARIIRRTAAACFSPSSDADEDYDYLPHMQLDKVTHAISREAFGPLYLVT
uniref:Uncharacterized protein n=1 Tax=Oryza rufipogon TaxID=4529 RepID=A0A0E0NQM5_ORYRU